MIKTHNNAGHHNHSLRCAVIVAQSLERIKARYAYACDKGAEEPAVLVVDLNDAVGRAVADSFGDPVEIAAIAALAIPGTSAIVFWGLPKHVGRDVVAAVLPAAAGGIDRTHPLGGVLCIVVAAGWATAYAVLTPN